MHKLNKEPKFKSQTFKFKVIRPEIKMTQYVIPSNDVEENCALPAIDDVTERECHQSESTMSAHNPSIEIQASSYAVSSNNIHIEINQNIHLENRQLRNNYQQLSNSYNSLNNLFTDVVNENVELKNYCRDLQNEIRYLKSQNNQLLTQNTNLIEQQPTMMNQQMLNHMQSVLNQQAQVNSQFDANQPTASNQHPPFNQQMTPQQDVNEFGSSYLIENTSSSMPITYMYEKDLNHFNELFSEILSNEPQQNSTNHYLLY